MRKPTGSRSWVRPFRFHQITKSICLHFSESTAALYNALTDAHDAPGISLPV